MSKNGYYSGYGNPDNDEDEELSLQKRKLITVPRLGVQFDQESFALDDLLRVVKKHKKENKEDF